jgi:hypothetical protein
MTTPFRIIVLTALTGSVICSFPIRAAEIGVLHCESSKDCPSTSHCQIRPHHKTGTCVPNHSVKKKYR